MEKKSLNTNIPLQFWTILIFWNYFNEKKKIKSKDFKQKRKK